MSPITHFLCGWTVALAPGLDRRARAAIALAGVAPDLDGLGIVVDLATKKSEHPTELWGTWHHVLGHGVVGALAVTIACLAFTRRSEVSALKVGALALVSFHLHLLGDLVGARGPDGDQWPIHYAWPFAPDVGLTWSGQWALNAWPNFAITGAFLVVMFVFAVRRGVSPLEMVSARANDAFVRTLRARFAR